VRKRRWSGEYWGSISPAAERRLESLTRKHEVTENGCWEWTGYRRADGYGMYRTDTRNLTVHRMAYQELVGPLADDVHLHHLCENHACFNPDHLELTKRSEHVRIHRKGKPQVGGRKARA
jgi:hypothetical protein